MTPNELEKKRIKLANELEKKLKVKVSNIQARLYSQAVQKISQLAVDSESKLSFSVKNIKTADSVAVLIEQKGIKENKTLLKWLVNQLKKLFRINSRYFKSLRTNNKTSDDAILRRVMLRYGYDIKTRKIQKTGVLSGLAQVSNIAARVGQQIAQSLAARTTINTFKKTFKQFFINPNGLGVVESQFNRFTQDLFQDFDRETQVEYANKLKLNHAVYTGTSMKRTRDFCNQRIGNVYTVEEIDKWNRLEWKGKRPNVPVKVQCGGYNCRHHLSFVSDQRAQRLAKRRGGINNYNE